jgi:two-component system nitrogen regulation sensor histidine kinase NtrY
LLQGFDNAYLYAARLLDPQVMQQLAVTNETVAEFRAIEATRFGIQVAFGILLLGVTVVVLLSAIWLGIGFANRLVSPIRNLIDAANEVARGNLSVQVRPRSSDGDVGALGMTFNTMTSQLRGQRKELLAASEQIDARRRFTEAVLSGATAGVVGLDRSGRVTIVNRAAVQLLGVVEADAIGRPIAEVLPQLQQVVLAALHDERVEHRDQITMPRAGRDRTINVRVTTERASGHDHGYVVTLDDITDLVSAQRSSAWADVARRIAHEIKNPLTPIQLSAERLKRRFGKAIAGDDKAVFELCTDTIIRQVGDIGRMVDEFSSFARMPKPRMEDGNLSDAVREAVFLISEAHPEIGFKVELPRQPLLGRFDARLMAQALTNVVKNATEAIAALPPAGQAGAAVTVSGRATDDGIVIDVVDTGIGFPKANRHKLLEPYVTTREKGTGLGLAIVTKIIEEHGGRVELLDSPAVATGGHGALVRVVLPRAEPTAASGQEETAAQAAMPPVQ